MKQRRPSTGERPPARAVAVQGRRPAKVASEPIVPRLQRAVWLCGVTILTGLAGGALWHRFQIGQMRVYGLRARIALADVARLDESLMASARMLAQTGDPRWAQRFRQNVPAMAAALKQVEATTAGRTARPLLAKTQQLGEASIAVERHAIELALAGRGAEARSVLSGEAQSAKEAFSESYGQLIRRVEEESAWSLDRLEDHAGLEALALALALGSILVSFRGMTKGLRDARWQLDVARRETGRAQQELQLSRAQLSAQTAQMVEARRAADRALVEQISRLKKRDASNRLLSKAFESTNDVVLITDATPGESPKVLHVNDAIEQMTGYSRSEVLGKSPKMFQGEKTDSEVVSLIREQIQAGQPVQAEILNYRKDGSEFWVELNIQPVCDENGFQTHWVSIQRDITERKEAERHIYSQSRHDALTGLPNRTLYQERLAEAIDGAGRRRDLVGVLFFDLDRFKHINDTLGHLVGDQLLQQVAHRLQAKLRPEDTVARLGGDEFTILLPGMKTPEEAVRAARRLLDALAAPFQVEDHELFVTGSIGVSVAPQDGSDIATLLKNADVAMYRAKEEGRDGYRVYTKTMDERALDRLLIETHLRKALDRKEFSLVYQPQVDLVSGRVFGGEALIRWQNETLGKVSPGQFIPIAEETGLILAIGEWALREACLQAYRWRETGLDVRVSVNLSARQFSQPNLLKRVSSVLEETQLPPQLLDIELTEGTLLQVSSRSNKILMGLKELGIRLSVDDFGTGYSSLAYLRTIPLDILKVDKSFVDGLGEDRRSEAVVRALVELGHGIGLEIIAEGVETDIQRMTLIEMGCDAMQGYLVSPPTSAEEFAKLARMQFAPPRTLLRIAKAA